jgi:uncharacterized membrane protein SpoIIM required for sporulation
MQFTLSGLLWGVIFIIVGTISLKFNYQLVGFTGRQDWVEQRLGAGSTYLFFKLVSIFMVIFGLLSVTGLGIPLLQWVLSPLSNLFNQGKNS